MRIECLMHVPFEGPAVIDEWASDRGHSLVNVSVFAEDAQFPSQSDFDWLIVMGGPMGVHDEAEHPWLPVEKAFILDSIKAGKTVVGICLGAQLIAHVLGARVYHNQEKEIGWFPIELTDAGRSSEVFGFLPSPLTVYHWHGDTFELPAGAVHLARSAVCEHQAFLYEGRVLGLQCHLESTRKSVSDLIIHGEDEMVSAPHIQSAAQMLATTDHDYAQLKAALFGILDRLPA